MKYSKFKLSRFLPLILALIVLSGCELLTDKSVVEVPQSEEVGQEEIADEESADEEIADQELSDEESSSERGGLDDVEVSESIDGEVLILQAFEDHQSDVMVQAVGVVDRTLADDLIGSRHQKFIVRLSSGHTVLVSHNIDIAPRIPLAAGDEVEFRGEYEWNDLGGVVHWTHHDPNGSHEGGWIWYDGEYYE